MTSVNAQCESCCSFKFSIHDRRKSQRKGCGAAADAST
eukprot:CAMPEP_0172196452 /NCGR_PEP_ID=MMETSP1050-20130122/26834_1 /TAXON_ID=233186 /ORGANISM="Cryptomonas curvata, Strain CCAP979/52" /LENGTH=37 /DNA_ID= /DNA_START= /DNA_END= /DNA_ORIENTATION=